MHPLLNNKFVRFGLISIAILVAIFIFLSLMSLTISGRSSLNSIQDMDYYATPSVSVSSGRATYSEEMVMMDDGVMMESKTTSSYMPIPIPTPDGYTSGLESYETTNYSVSGRLKAFDQFCDELSTLKTDVNIHFKSLNESTNNCNATFYVAETETDRVIGVLASYKGVEFTRSTESVTRHRQQIQNQTSIISQQLNSVSRSLTAAETQFDELAEFARQSKDASALSEAIRYKLQNVDTLTSRKISLTSQLNNLYQQAVDLEERIGVVQFSVNVTRANPIYVGKYERQWDTAWENLKDSANQALINLTAFFATFLLWLVQAFIYLLVIIIVIRGLWKFIKLLWRKW